jgi:hypothetical protein
MGDPVSIHPLDALLRLVSLAAGEVNYFTLLIRALELDEVSVQYEKTRPLSYGKEGESSSEEVKERTSQADLHLWVTARQSSMDRLAKYSKMALDAGIDERRVRMAEHTGEMIIKVLQHFSDGLSLTAEQRRQVPQAVRSALTLIEGTAQEVKVA